MIAGIYVILLEQQYQTDLFVMISYICTNRAYRSVHEISGLEISKQISSANLNFIPSGQQQQYRLQVNR